MATKNLALKLLINAEDKASSVLSSLRNHAGTIAAAISGYFSVSFFKSSIDDAERLQTQIGTLEGIIKATGSAAGLTANDIVEMSKRLDEATLGSAEGFRTAAGELLTFKSVGKDAFETTLMLAQDLAQAGFGTLESNTIQLGKALEDPVKGMSALTKSGVTFSDAQKDVIKGLVETGDKAKAQGLIIKAVAEQVGGAGSSAGGGLSGAIDLVGKRLTDFKEKLGSGMLKPLTAANNKVAEFLGTLNKSGVVEGFGNAIGAAFGTAVDWTTRAYDAVTGFYATLQQTGAIERIKSAATDTFATVNQWLQDAKTFASDFFTTISESEAFSELAAAEKATIETIKEVGKSLSEPFYELFNVLSNGKLETQTFGQTFGDILTKLAQAATVFVSGFSTGLETLKVAFYGLAGAGAWVISTLIQGVAKTQEGLAKITFGEVSRKWAAAAADNKLIAESFAESARVNFAKAETAMEGVAISAQRTNASLQTLVGDGLSQSNAALNANAQAAQAAKSAGDALAASTAQWVNPQAALVEQLMRQKAELVASGASQTELQAISAKLTEAQGAAKTAAEQHAAAMASAGSSAGDAAKNVDSLNQQVGDLPKTPKKIYINAETREASDRIEQIKAPTASEHTVDAAQGVSVALGEIDKLKVGTSSTHTIYVNRVDNGVAPAQATGGPAGQPTGQPWRFNTGGYTPRSGKLPGFGGGDKIRALLEAGEFIIRKEAVAKLGVPFMHAVNAGQLPTGGEVIKRARGGAVGFDMDEELKKLKAAREQAAVSDLIANARVIGALGRTQIGTSSTIATMKRIGDQLRKLGRGDLSSQVSEIVSLGNVKTGDLAGQRDRIDLLKNRLFAAPAAVQVPAIQTPKLNIPMPAIPSVPAAAPQSAAAPAASTLRVQFVSPTGASVTGTFNPGDGPDLLRTLKDAGAITV